MYVCVCVWLDCLICIELQGAAKSFTSVKCQSLLHLLTVTIAISWLCVLCISHRRLCVTNVVSKQSYVSHLLVSTSSELFPHTHSHSFVSDISSSSSKSVVENDISCVDRVVFVPWHCIRGTQALRTYRRTQSGIWVCHSVTPLSQLARFYGRTSKIVTIV